jgi:hypothetical protein
LAGAAESTLGMAAVAVRQIRRLGLRRRCLRRLRLLLRCGARGGRGRCLAGVLGGGGGLGLWIRHRPGGIWRSRSGGAHRWVTGAAAVADEGPMAAVVGVFDGGYGRRGMAQGGGRL